MLSFCITEMSDWSRFNPAHDIFIKPWLKKFVSTEIEIKIVAKYKFWMQS